MDVGSGVPLDGAGAAFAGELDAVSICDGGEIGGRTLLIRGAGIPGLSGAFGADGDLTMDRLPNGRRDGGSDEPFARLELDVGSLSVSDGNEEDQEGDGEAGKQGLHIALQNITGVVVG